jgi:hypothetical protein
MLCFAYTFIHIQVIKTDEQNKSKNITEIYQNPLTTYSHMNTISNSVLLHSDLVRLHEKDQNVNALCEHTCCLL